MILVGKEPFCDFQSIQQAVNACESYDDNTAMLIYILSGVYEEQVIITRSRLTVKGIGTVVIQYGLSAKDNDHLGEELGTFRTPTLYVGGQLNKIENLTIINSAGYGEDVGQAIAVYADCDQIIFRQCKMIGYQDTLFTGLLPDKQKDGTPFPVLAERKVQAAYRQYYDHCYISGSIDFIFGGAMAYFHQCEIKSRHEKNRQGGYITAASTPKNQKTGFVFHECFLSAEDQLEAVYLGRPWRAYAKTAFVNCKYGNHIHPAGWDDWSNADNQQTIHYEEIFNPEDTFERRVAWSKQSYVVNSKYDIETVFSQTEFYKSNLKG